MIDSLFWEKLDSHNQNATCDIVLPILLSELLLIISKELVGDPDGPAVN